MAAMIDSISLKIHYQVVMSEQYKNGLVLHALSGWEDNKRLHVKCNKQED